MCPVGADSIGAIRTFAPVLLKVLGRDYSVATVLFGLASFNACMWSFQNASLDRGILEAPKLRKFVGGRGPGPRWGILSRLPDPLVGWGRG